MGREESQEAGVPDLPSSDCEHPPSPSHQPQAASTGWKCLLPPVGRFGAKSGPKGGREAVAEKIDVTMAPSTAPLSAQRWSLRLGGRKGDLPGVMFLSLLPPPV
jgi:hypothetical protein